MPWKCRPRPATQQAAPELTADMTAHDLIFELSQLQYERDESHRVWMDREARDFILASLSARLTPRRA